MEVLRLESSARLIARSSAPSSASSSARSSTRSSACPRARLRALLGSGSTPDSSNPKTESASAKANENIKDLLHDWKKLNLK